MRAAFIAALGAATVVLVVVLAFPSMMHSSHSSNAERIVRAVQAGDQITRMDVEKHLGESSGRAFGGWDASYRLGDDQSYFAIDSSWLVIRLEQPGDRVIDAQIIVD